MSQQFTEGRLRFDFPDGWMVCRPETCSFYQRHFQSFAGGCKEVDFVAYDPESRTLWLLEVKDYSHAGRIKSLSVEGEVALKVRDVLALLPAAVRDNSPGKGGSITLREFWDSAKRLTSIHIVLHFDVPRHPSKLFPVEVDLANLQMRLRSAVRAIDPRALVSSRQRLGTVPWSVV